MAAHIYFWCIQNDQPVHGNDDTEYRHALAQKEPDFGLLRDIAKAQKHVMLSRGSPLVDRAANVTRRSLGWGEGRWGEARFGSPPQIVVATGSGQLRVVDVVVTRALRELEAEMARVGIPESADEKPPRAQIGEPG